MNSQYFPAKFTHSRHLQLNTQKALHYLTLSAVCLLNILCNCNNVSTKHASKLQYTLETVSNQQLTFNDWNIYILVRFIRFYCKIQNPYILLYIYSWNGAKLHSTCQSVCLFIQKKILSHIISLVLQNKIISYLVRSLKCVSIFLVFQTLSFCVIFVTLLSKRTK